MRTHKTFTETRFVTLCDRCGRILDEEEDPFEWQEHISIRFRGGYASVFEEGSVVEGDFCQHCIKKILGKYLHVTEDSLFHPQHTLSPHPGHNNYARQPIEE